MAEEFRGAIHGDAVVGKFPWPVHERSSDNLV
jgi:hypothetical protein